MRSRSLLAKMMSSDGIGTKSIPFQLISKTDMKLDYKS